MASRIKTCINMASVVLSLASLFAAGWLWERWPESTASLFVCDCSLNTLLDSEIPRIQSQYHHLDYFRNMLQQNTERISIQSPDRTLMEHLLGRQKFIINGEQGRYHLVIERGSIVEGPTLEYNNGHVMILDVL